MALECETWPFNELLLGISAFPGTFIKNPADRLNEERNEWENRGWVRIQFKTYVHKNLLDKLCCRLASILQIQIIYSCDHKKKTMISSKSVKILLSVERRNKDKQRFPFCLLKKKTNKQKKVNPNHKTVSTTNLRSTSDVLTAHSRHSLRVRCSF